MPARRALALASALALAVGALGIGLRLAVPVAPVDDSYRDVVRHYRAPDGPRAGSNSGETSVPY